MRLRSSLLVLFPLAWGISLPAQTAPADALASVTGSVTNSLTGEPILRAHIALRGAIQAGPDMSMQAYGALTNREGKFTVTKLPPGRYSVSADRVGFVMPAKSGAFGSSSITLGAGEKKEELKLALTPTGAITGRVLDASGEPVQNANVQAEGSGGSQGTTTDDRGAFRIGGLRPGKYRLRASHQQTPFGAEIRTDGTKEVHYAATYYPNTLMRTFAQRIDVAPAAQLRGIEIRLISTPIVSVSGKVSGLPDGSVRAGISATRAADEGFGGGPQDPVKADGTFNITRLDPGKYTLVAVTIGPGPQRSLSSAPVEIEVAGANIEHLELRMAPPFEVSGQVRFDDERARFPQMPQRPGQPPPAQAYVPARQVRLDGGVGFMGRDVSADVGADDTFTLPKVPAGRYHIALTWGPGYVKSVTVGNTETEGDVLDVRNGPAGAVTIFVSSLTCDVSGTVNGPDGPLAGARVLIVQETDGRRFPRLASAKPDGTYAFTGLPPGKYRIGAIDDDSSVALEDDDDHAEAIELRAGDKITKDLKQK